MGDLNSSNLVVWVPTPWEIVGQMLALANISPEDVVYDLGCGDGRVLISAVRDFGARRAVGYELRKDLCEACSKTAEQLTLQDRIEVIRGDLRGADLSEASVVTLYLSTEANRLLLNRMQETLRPGSRVVTYLFPIPGWISAREVDLSSLSFKEGRFVGRLYLYLLPQ
jgi:tRNA A58 N-methylase Trm61